MTGVILSDKEVNSILNEQDKEIKSLKKENEQLKKENNQLELQNSTLMKEVAEYSRKAKELEKENEQLKKGMIGVVDRYIKNVECNPPSSARTYGKIKGALINIREDLRDLIGDLE